MQSFPFPATWTPISSPTSQTFPLPLSSFQTLYHLIKAFLFLSFQSWSHFFPPHKTSSFSPSSGLTISSTSHNLLFNPILSLSPSSTSNSLPLHPNLHNYVEIIKGLSVILFLYFPFHYRILRILKTGSPDDRNPLDLKLTTFLYECIFKNIATTRML